jgi:hypothetical protein
MLIIDCGQKEFQFAYFTKYSISLLSCGKQTQLQKQEYNITVN